MVREREGKEGRRVERAERRVEMAASGMGEGGAGREMERVVVVVSDEGVVGSGFDETVVGLR